MEKRGLPLKKQNKTKTNQTKKPINQNKTKKPNPPAKKKKPKIKEKIKNKNFSPQKKPPKQNSRVLLKTIPNKSEMKNKYKTKLKKICIYPTPTFSGWQYLLMKTFSWLSLLPKPSPEVTRGWSGLAFPMQTLGFVMWTCLAEGKFAGLCGTRDSSPNLPLPFFSIHITLVHK